MGGDAGTGGNTLSQTTHNWSHNYTCITPNGRRFSLQPSSSTVHRRQKGSYCDGHGGAFIDDDNEFYPEVPSTNKVVSWYIFNVVCIVVILTSALAVWNLVMPARDDFDWKFSQFFDRNNQLLEELVDAQRVSSEGLTLVQNQIEYSLPNSEEFRMSFNRHLHKMSSIVLELEELNNYVTTGLSTLDPSDERLYIYQDYNDKQREILHDVLEFSDHIRSLGSRLDQMGLEELRDLNQQVRQSTQDMYSHFKEQLVRQTRDIVLKEILSDDIGLYDYASSTQGGEIVLSQTSTSYHEEKVQSEGSGFKNWLSSWFQSPATREKINKSLHNRSQNVISPSKQPGSCWAFSGPSAFVTIDLSAEIVPNKFSLEHIMTPDLSNAPKNFRVSGWDSAVGRFVTLGEYEYSLKKNDVGDQVAGIKSFACSLPECLNSYSRMRIDFVSNHGNEEHTCVYRFRAHGSPKGQQ